MFKLLYVDVYCLIAHSIVISRRPTMRVTATGSWQVALLTYRLWNRTLGTIVPPGRLKFAGYVPVKNVLISPVDRPVEPTGHRSGRVMKISTGSISGRYGVDSYTCHSNLRSSANWTYGHFLQPQNVMNVCLAEYSRATRTAGDQKSLSFVFELDFSTMPPRLTRILKAFLACF